MVVPFPPVTALYTGWAKPPTRAHTRHRATTFKVLFCLALKGFLGFSLLGDSHRRVQKDHSGNDHCIPLFPQKDRDHAGSQQHINQRIHKLADEPA